MYCERWLLSLPEFKSFAKGRSTYLIATQCGSAMRGLPPNPSLTGVLAEGPAIFLTDCGPPDRCCIGLAQALHVRIDLVRRPQVHDQDVILGRRDQVIQPRGHLGAAPGRQPALEDRQLHPVAVAFHRLEDVAPAFRCGYVVGDDVEALRGHVGYRGR